MAWYNNQKKKAKGFSLNTFYNDFVITNQSMCTNMFIIRLSFKAKCY